MSRDSACSRLFRREPCSLLKLHAAVCPSNLLARNVLVYIRKSELSLLWACHFWRRSAERKTGIFIVFSFVLRLIAPVFSLLILFSFAFSIVISFFTFVVSLSFSLPPWLSNFQGEEVRADDWKVMNLWKGFQKTWACHPHEQWIPKTRWHATCMWTTPATCLCACNKQSSRNSCSVRDTVHLTSGSRAPRYRCVS